MTRLFGTDGIRGIVNQDLTIELACKIGKALSFFNNKTIIIGQDTRISSPLISSCLISGCLSKGLNVYDEGITSTPCIAYLSKSFNAIGVMITASHNPFYYNGIKIFVSGNKLTKKEEELLENIILDEEINYSNNIGTYKNSSLKYKYIDYLKKHLSKNRLRIGLDLANGALSSLGVDIFKNVTNSLYLYNNIPTGFNINDAVGSTHINEIQRIVNKHCLDLGFSYDGDGDRVLVSTKNHPKIGGNIVLYILSIYFFDILNYQNRKIVLTKDVNLGVIKSFEKHNIEVFLCDIGDSNVRKAMDEHNALLGGEDSGHIITPYSRYGDGILTSLIFLKAISNLDISLDKLINNVTFYPEIKYNLTNYNKDILNNNSVVNCINNIKEETKNVGSLLVRPSGTENLIRIYICHVDPEKLNYCNNLLSSTFLKVGKEYER